MPDNLEKMMDEKIIETLAAEALKHIDITDFAAKLAPKLLKEMERGIMATVREMDWMDFVASALQSDEVQKEITKRVLAGLRGAQNRSEEC